MSESEVERAGAGVSFLFAPGERPDTEAWREAIDACQARVRLAREDAAGGSAELVMNGLTFEVDGLAPTAKALGEPDGEVLTAELDAVRVYPGHHLSGGLGMLPVVRALAALAAEIGTRLPARAVIWHPAATEVEPQAFARATLAWLGGGAFPAHVLTALTLLGDGSVTTRGLAHFTGQEATLRPKSGETDEQALRLAAEIVDHLVQHGPLTQITEMRLAGEMICFEPARRGDQVWVWRKAG
jgi:hypothetical protein